jgi:hypothetical protein
VKYSKATARTQTHAAIIELLLLGGGAGLQRCETETTQEGV